MRKATQSVLSRDRSYQFLAATTAAAALILTIVTLAAAESAHCAFGDGRSYCAIAEGRPAPEPFNRRPLLPLLVQLTHPADVVSGFRIWNLSALLLLAAGVALLTAALTRVVAGPRHAPTGGLVAASLVMLMPHGLRLAWVFPVLTDAAAMALGVLWVLTLNSRWLPVAPVCALLTVLCREQWALPVLLVGCWLILRWRRPAAGALHLGAAFTGALIDLTRPAAGHPYTTTLQQSLDRITSIDNLWSLMTIFGVLAALYLTSRSTAPQKPPLETILVLITVSQVCVGMMGGTDVSRLIAGGLPFLICLAVAWNSRTRLALIRMGVVVASLMLLWRIGDFPLPGAYRQFYRPYAIPSESLRVAADIALSAATILFLITTRDRKRRGVQPLPTLEETEVLPVRTAGIAVNRR